MQLARLGFRIDSKPEKQAQNRHEVITTSNSMRGSRQVCTVNGLGGGGVPKPVRWLNAMSHCNTPVGVQENAAIKMGSTSFQSWAEASGETPLKARLAALTYSV
jgi:hypothetical protein